MHQLIRFAFNEMQELRMSLIEREVSIEAFKAQIDLIVIECLLDSSDDSKQQEKC